MVNLTSHLLKDVGAVPSGYVEYSHMNICIRILFEHRFLFSVENAVLYESCTTCKVP